MVNPLHCARAIVTGTFLIVFSVVSSSRAEPIVIETLDRTTPVDFQSEVLPLLRASCLACHNATQAEGELNLETPASIRKGGSRGSAIAEQPADSLLLRAAAHQDDDLVMPPPGNNAEAAPLTPRQLGLLRLWIKQGGGGEISTDGSIAWRPLPPQLQPIFATAITPDGKFAACGRGKHLLVYHVPTQQLAAELRDEEVTTAQASASATAHVDVIRSLAFDEAGEWLASGGFRTVKLWRRPHVAHVSESKTDGAITAVAVSGDGKRSALGETDGRIVVRNAETGEETFAIDAHSASVTGLAFTADGTMLVSTSIDKALRLWNAADGKPISTVETPAEVTALTTVGEDLLVTGHQDKRLRVWELAKLAASVQENENPQAPAPLREIEGHEDSVRCLASDAEDTFVSGGEDGTVRLWSASSGQQQKRFTHGAAVTVVAVSSGAKRIAVAGGNVVQLFGIEDGSLIAELKGDPRRAEELSRIEADIAFTTSTVELTRRDIKEYSGPERRVKVTGEAVAKAEKELEKAEKTLKEKQQALEKAKDDEKKRESAEKAVKDALSARDVVLTIIERAKAVAERAKQELADANAVVTSGEEKLKQLEAQKAAAEKAVGVNSQPVSSVEFSPDGSQLLVAKGDVLHVYSADGRPLRSLADHTANIASAAMTSGGRLLAAGQDGQAVVYDVQSEWKLARTIGDVASSELLADRVLAVALQPGSGRLATGGGLPSRRGELKLWNMADGHLVLDLSAAHNDAVLAVAFSPDGELLASGGADKQVKVHRVADGQLVATLPGHTAHVLGVSFSGDGKLLATCGGDRVVKLWDVPSGRQLQSMVGTMYRIGRYRQEVTAVQFVGDSEQILAASGDGTVRLHRTSSEKEFHVYDNASTWLYAAAASADGRAVIAGGADGVLRLWSGRDRSPQATFP